MWKKSRRLLALLAVSLLVALFAAALASSFPADLALLSALDLTAYVDAVVGVYLMATVIRIRPLVQVVRQTVGSWMRLARSRRKRSRSIAREHPQASANDNDRADDPVRLAAA
jgi:hypothetical protein